MFATLWNAILAAFGLGSETDTTGAPSVGAQPDNLGTGEDGVD